VRLQLPVYTVATVATDGVIVVPSIVRSSSKQLWFRIKLKIITEGALESTFFPSSSELVTGTFNLKKLQGEFVTGVVAMVPYEVFQAEGPSSLVACRPQPTGSYSKDQCSDVAVYEGEVQQVQDRLGGCIPHQVQNHQVKSTFISGCINNNVFKAQQETNVSTHRVLALRHYELHLYPYGAGTAAAYLDAKGELVIGK